jgi:hypothetical protein
MKWVYIGEVQAAAFVLAAAYFDRKYASAYLTGGIAAGGIMHVCYIHAKSAGLASSLPGTETTGNGTPGGIEMEADTWQ